MNNELPNKYYFINKFDTNYIIKQEKNTVFIYRNYNSKNNLNTILKLKKFLKKKNTDFLYQTILSWQLN
jgi:hypothetical protein